MSKGPGSEVLLSYRHVGPGRGDEQYSPTNKLLTKFKEKEDNVKVAEVHVDLDVCIGGSLAALNSDDDGEHKGAILKSGGRLLLIRPGLSASNWSQ